MSEAGSSQTVGLSTPAAVLQLTLIQTELFWEDAVRNRARIERVIGGLAERSDLIVLPEMFTTGFSMAAARCAETMGGETVTWMRALAEEHRAAICGSVIIEEQGRYFNRFVLVSPDGTVESYDKRHLFRLAGEHVDYAAGAKRRIIDYRGWRLCPMVCYDLRYPVWSRNRNDYDLLIYVANWPQPRHHHWEMLLRARAIENQCYVAAVNRVGTDGNGKHYVGGSTVIDYDARALASLGDVAGTATASVSLEELREYRERLPFGREADEFVIDAHEDRGRHR